MTLQTRSASPRASPDRRTLPGHRDTQGGWYRRGVSRHGHQAGARRRDQAVARIVRRGQGTTARSAGARLTQSSQHRRTYDAVTGLDDDRLPMLKSVGQESQPQTAMQATVMVHFDDYIRKEAGTEMMAKKSALFEVEPELRPKAVPESNFEVRWRG